MQCNLCVADVNLGTIVLGGSSKSATFDTSNGSNRYHPTCAGQVAQQLGVWQVARELGLCCESLKRRVEEKASRRQGAMRFVEVRGTDVMAAAGSDGTVVELSATDGTRMAVRLVCCTFSRRQPPTMNPTSACNATGEPASI